MSTIDVARSPWAIAWRRLRSRRGCIGRSRSLPERCSWPGWPPRCSPALEGQDPYTYHIDLLDPSRGNIPHGPLGGVSTSHWFGVEPLTGRDLFAITVYGARTSLLIGLAATVLGSGGRHDRRPHLGLPRRLDGHGAQSASPMSCSASPILIFMIALSAVVPPDFPRPVLLC